MVSLFKKKNSKNIFDYRAVFVILRENIRVLPSILILVLFVLAAIFSEILAPHSPREINLAYSLTPPFWQEGGTIQYLLGTDRLGRCILSRMIFGARVSLIVSVIGVIFSGLIGGFLGIIAGYKGGRLDTIISRAVDTLLGFPAIILALVLAVVAGASLGNVIFVVIFIFWTHYARQARGETLKIRSMDYVVYSKMIGSSDSSIIVKHIIPNILNSLIVLTTFHIGTVITLEAGLSFLGVGVPPPSPSWGGMVADGRALIERAWWVSFMPGISIMLIVLSGNFLGDWLRDKLDPRLRNI